MYSRSHCLAACTVCVTHVFRVFATDSKPAIELPLTDEDSAQLERWKGMQRQHQQQQQQQHHHQQQQQDGVGNQLPCFSTVSTANSDITTTAATTTTTAGDMGPLRLSSADSQLADRYIISGQMWSPLRNISSADIASCLPTTTTATATAGDMGPLRLTSADSRLADQCLANTGMIGRPLISLSLADITGCLQTTASGVDDDDATTVTRQRSFAGYGVGEIIPSLSDRYVLSFHCMHWHWSVIAVNSLSVLRLFIYCDDLVGWLNSQTFVVVNIFACCFALFLCQTHELITVVKADQTFYIGQN